MFCTFARILPVQSHDRIVIQALHKNFQIYILVLVCFANFSIGTLVVRKPLLKLFFLKCFLQSRAAKEKVIAVSKSATVVSQRKCVI